MFQVLDLSDSRRSPLHVDVKVAESKVHCNLCIPEWHNINQYSRYHNGPAASLQKYTGSISLGSLLAMLLARYLK